MYRKFWRKSGFFFHYRLSKFPLQLINSMWSPYEIKLHYKAQKQKSQGKSFAE